MKLSLDENISDRLLKKLEDIYPNPEHVCTFGLAGTEDGSIWGHARQRGFYIVTQDADFAERIQLDGVPPKVVWLRCGNAPTCKVERLLRENFQALAQLETSPDLRIVELFR